MNSDNQNSDFYEIPQDAIVLLNKVGFSSELIKDKIVSVTPDFSRRFHQELMSSKIFASWDGVEKWFTTGIASQILKPGEQWQDGHFRLRIIAEFVPDVFKEEEIPVQESGKSNDSSLDDIRNSIEPS